MRTILAFLFIACSFSGIAQELRANVTVNTPKLQVAEPKVFKNLETTLRDMLNNTKWTEDEFTENERIQCSFTLNIKEELSATSFKGELLIQATRPIYNSSAETVIFTHSDKDVTFTFEEFQPLDFVKNSYNNNLGSIVSFYAHIILGMDYDSFSINGGSTYFQGAQDILSTIPQNVASAFPGWRSIDGQRNRYWIVENILSPRMVNMRKASYTYHRLGLDMMAEDTELAKVSMTKAITDLGKVNKDYPNSMILQIFANAKSNEIIEVYKQATPTQKNDVYSSMIKIDAANASKYRIIRR